jgi:alpha/beta superfamily hydrolase
MTMNINHKHIFFKSGEHLLEGVLSSCQKSGPGVVICHPHPLYGGNMNNNVVLGLKDTLQEQEFQILRFNFRGVNLSEGNYDDGKGEVNDVVSAVNFLRSCPMVESERLFLVGYSFGAWVGLRAALTINSLKAVAGIAPPCNLFDFSFLPNINTPILIVEGDEDIFCADVKMENFFKKISSFKHKVILPTADHFFSGREGEVGKEVKLFFSHTLKSLRSINS